VYKAEHNGKDPPNWTEELLSHETDHKSNMSNCSLCRLFDKGYLKPLDCPKCHSYCTNLKHDKYEYIGTALCYKAWYDVNNDIDIEANTRLLALEFRRVYEKLKKGEETSDKRQIKAWVII
jgi:hypothetical protein